MKRKIYGTSLAERTMTIWALLFLVLGPIPLTGHPVDSSSSCTNFLPKCWFILNSPSGLSNFNIPIDIGKTVTGVVTINGMLNPTPLSRTEFDVLKLLKFQNPTGYNDVIMQLELQVRKTELVGKEHEHTLDVRGVLVDSGSGGIPRLVYYPGERNLRDYVVDPEAENNGTYWIFRGGRIRIQISDLEATKLHAYKFYFGDPGKAVEYQFNYGSEENWQQFEHLRLNATRVVANEDEKLLTSYHNVTVCSDATPVLCGSESEIIRVRNLGEAVALECSGFGAQYLTSRWEDENGTAIEGFSEQVSNRDADSFIQSTYVVKHFNVDHIGKYYCSIRNENFNISVQKSFSLEYSKKIFIVRSPKETVSPNVGVIRLSWIIDGWPLSRVHIRCSGILDADFSVSRNLYPNYSSVPRLHLILSATSNSTPDQFECAVFDAGSLLEEIKFIKQIAFEKEELASADEVPEHSHGLSVPVALVIGIACGSVFSAAAIYVVTRFIRHRRPTRCDRRGRGSEILVPLKDVDDTTDSDQQQATSLLAEVPKSTSILAEDPASPVVGKVSSCPSSSSEEADKCDVFDISMGSNLSSSFIDKASETTKMHKLDAEDYSKLRLAVPPHRRRSQSIQYFPPRKPLILRSNSDNRTRPVHWESDAFLGADMIGDFQNYYSPTNPYKDSVDDFDDSRNASKESGLNFLVSQDLTPTNIKHHALVPSSESENETEEQADPEISTSDVII